MGVALLLAQGTAGLCCGDHIGTHSDWPGLLDGSLQQCHHQQPAAHIKRGSATQTLPTTASSLLGHKPQNDRSPGAAWQAGSWSFDVRELQLGRRAQHELTGLCADVEPKNRRFACTPSLFLSPSFHLSLLQPFTWPCFLFFPYFAVFLII